MAKFKEIEMNYAIDDFRIYCKQKDLRRKTMMSYESTLRLFERYLSDKGITNLNEIAESICRDYIDFTKNRGKYSFVADNNSKIYNHPDNRTNCKKEITLTTINNYIRNLKVSFNWALSEERIIKKNSMLKIKQFKNNRKPKEQISDREFKRLLQNIDVTKLHEFRYYVIRISYGHKDEDRGNNIINGRCYRY